MSRLSSEKVCAQHNQIQANVISVDSRTSVVALAGRREITLVNLEQPTHVLKTIQRHSKYEVSASEFHPKRSVCYALASNQSLEVYELDHELTTSTSMLNYNMRPFTNSIGFRGLFDYSQPDGPISTDNRGPTIVIKQGHTRAITDINWCPFNNDLIATSSIDTFVHVWDIREYRKPSLSLSSVVHASQVKWNKADDNLIATAHDVDVRIWDKRKGNSPLHYIAAHVQKIYGLDWSPNSGTELATCSQDNTVKFWDLNVLRNKAESIIATNLPVWRAKYTPVGNGIITVVVSHLRRIGDNSLWLWNGNCLDKPVYSFVGPQDVVIDFGFRIKRKTQRPMNEYLANFAEMNEDFINYKRDEMIDYHASAISRTENPKSPSKKVSIQPDLGIEVITWSKDQSLRIWDVDDNILKLVDYHPEDLQRFNNRYLVDDKFQHRHLQSRHLNRRHSSSSKLESEHDRFDSAVSGRRPEVLLEENDDPSAAAKWAEKLSSSLNRKSRSLDNSENSFINRRLTSANLRKNSLANSSSNFVSPTDLQEEFSLIDVSNLKNLWIEQMNAVKRFCVIRAKSPHNNFVYRIRIIFPNSYPNNIPPTFIFIDSSSSVIEEMTSIKEKSEEKPGQITNSDDMGPTGSKKNVFKPELFESPPKLTGKELKVFQESKADLLKILQNTAHMQVKRNRPCIEPCLRDLVAALDRRSTTMNLTNSLTPSLTMDSLYGSFHDVNIPFPRTCGARFCGADLLICFSRPSHLQLSANASNWQRNQIDSKTGYTPTPRALSALSYYLVSSKKSNTTGSTSSSGHVVMTASGENLPKILPISVSSFYRSGSSANSKVRHKSNKNKSHKMHSSKTRPVYVFNVAGLLPYNKFLAEYYIFDRDPIKMCTFNANLAGSINKRDHFNSWSLCKLIADPSVTQKTYDWWKCNPFGRKMLESLIDHYLNNLDIQMAAMLLCCFASRCLKCDQAACANNCAKRRYTRTGSRSVGQPIRKPPEYIQSSASLSIEDSKRLQQKLQKSLNLPLKADDNIKRNRSNSWSDIAEIDDSPSDASLSESHNFPSDLLIVSNRTSPSKSSVTNSRLPPQSNCKHLASSSMLATDTPSMLPLEISYHASPSPYDPALKWLSSEKQVTIDYVKQVYADLLFRWRLFDQKCQVLKHVQSSNLKPPLASHEGVEFGGRCSECHGRGTFVSDNHLAIMNNRQCHNCKRPLLFCSLCHVPVKGLSNFCIQCGHGGHAGHMHDWFMHNSHCPTGCGCECTNNTFEAKFG